MSIAISINLNALGDTIAAIPTINKLAKAHNAKITVFSSHPYLFKNHPSVKNSLPINSSKEGYKVYNVPFIKEETINNQKLAFKHSHIDIRQFHALSLGFSLLPEEMETDLYIEEEWKTEFKDYVVIHPTTTWESRTWDREKWQDLIYKLNNQNIPVVAIGKRSIEQGNREVYDKTVMDIDIPYGIDLMDNPESTIGKVRGLLKHAKTLVTMDSGILHIGGTTDVHIIQLGSSINPKFRAPYRKGSQNYKYNYIKGECDLFCASNLKYNLKEWNSIQGIPPLAKCLERKPTFECHSTSDQVVKCIKSLPQTKKKLLYITPHLSTGGAPQYLLKKIELLKEEYNISLVEYSQISNLYVVQRNQIFNLIPQEKRITLKENKEKLFNFITEINPDIIHLEEIPEKFMDREIAEKLYTPSRNYILIETSHDSSTNPKFKQFFPDKFMFVSNWQIDQYKDINVPSVLVEYPIEHKKSRNRNEACKRLNLDPNKKHIIHVGLFTPRKNQAEFFKYAHALPEYEFHCIGNLAENFAFYWESLKANPPKNLKIWGERSDIDNFYEAADLFLFTSKGGPKDKETMPLVIREALSWKLPILIYNLEVYQNYFDSYPVEYLTDDFSVNTQNIKNLV